MRFARRGVFLCLGIFGLWIATLPATEVRLTPKQRLGKAIFFDANLSTPPGQACAECHSPNQGFSNPDINLPVSRGVHRDRFGGRNDLSAAYAGFSPPLHVDEKEGTYVGGNFWDGRADNLVEQAKGPFLNLLEMANPDAAAVVAKIRQATYAPLFLEVFGTDALKEVDRAYHLAAEAIAAYEMSPEVNAFSSKYDLFLKKLVTLSPAEQRGLALFEDPKKGNCAACHPSQPGADGTPPLFTDFTYDNLGVPKNPENPFYYLPREFNPDGPRWVDLGLGAVVKKASENGKFRVPTLRNVAHTPPFMHNGVFKNLWQVVMFYSTRDVGPWPSPEVPETVNREELGDLKLTAAEIDDIVAFMLTLSDGYRLPAAAAH
ncbi:MAG TPA: cytochrome c peroxidase [Acidobacteriota bacterium]|nr:cytochrome c peroxidase [Acidobacteriota bacterium]HNU01548.1 cytochrome c peroxidase [Acidobacteriota bacterium]HPB27405.1 cytochrome c peroxidase [Acidobacteriota bacterium]HQO25182.1 cytochrome c peroxidase [Acidobacteriota bacterium]